MLCDLMLKPGMLKTVIELILEYLPNQDVYNFGQTCTYAKNVIKELRPEFENMINKKKFSQCYKFLC